MLPEISLDDEQFEEILGKARKMIPNLYPQWTDYNYHDPGITMLELMAWMKEMQQFHMDQIGPEHRKRYLTLLGEKQKARIPAEVMISVEEPEREGWLPRGSRFYTGDIFFETERCRYVEQAAVTRVIAPEKSCPAEKGGLHVPLFGLYPEPEAVFDLCFSSPLAEGNEHGIYFELFDGYEIRRNPIGEEDHFVPLARIEVSYRQGGRFVPAEWWKDETRQFLENGFVYVRMSHAMEPEEDGEYRLRFTLKEAGYDMAPVLERVSLNRLKARQTRTLCESHRIWRRKDKSLMAQTDTFLGAEGEYEIYLQTGQGLRPYGGEVKRWQEEEKTWFAVTGPEAAECREGLLVCFEGSMRDARLLWQGDGFPGQETAVEIRGLCSEGLEILVETGEDTGFFRPWSQTEDFSFCGPEDCCCAFDEDRGILAFGDGHRGRVPEGRVILAAGRTSLGSGGNVKAGTIKDSQGTKRFWRIANEEDGTGGQDRETLERCQERVHRKLKEIQRAVTYEDFEELTKRTPGLMIERVRAIPAALRPGQRKPADESRVTLVVKPCSALPRPKPGQAFMDNIRNMLEPRRLIGTRVSILAPEYIGIILFAEIETDTSYEKIKRELEEALKRCFQSQENDFGHPVSYGTIYGIMDVLDHVTRVKSLSIDAQGSGIRRSQNGDILLPPNGLAYLKEWDCMISSAG